MQRMTYKCKCCNAWEKSIPVEWADVSPRFCGNEKCDLSMKKSKGKKSFRSQPDMLDKVMPTAPQAPVKAKASKVRTKK